MNDESCVIGAGMCPQGPLRSRVLICNYNQGTANLQSAPPLNVRALEVNHRSMFGCMTLQYPLHDQSDPVGLGDQETKATKGRAISGSRNLICPRERH
jgi:hypothetical protein